MREQQLLANAFTVQVSPGQQQTLSYKQQKNRALQLNNPEIKNITSLTDMKEETTPDLSKPQFLLGSRQNVIRSQISFNCTTRQH